MNYNFGYTMMIEIVMVKTKRIESGLLDRLHPWLSAEKRKRIRRFKHKEDAVRALIGDVLVRTLIRTHLGICNQDIQLVRNEYGKPRLAKNHDFHFNLSHSGEWVVCAVNVDEIGIDIEQIKPIDIKLAQRFFSCAEYTQLMLQPEHERLSHFYEQWTLKESYIKAVGQGLSIPLDSFSILRNTEQEQIRLSKGNETYYFSQYTVDHTYKLSVCTHREHFFAQPNIWHWEELCASFLGEN